MCDDLVFFAVFYSECWKISILIYEVIEVQKPDMKIQKSSVHTWLSTNPTELNCFTTKQPHQESLSAPSNSDQGRRWIRQTLNIYVKQASD